MPGSIRASGSSGEHGSVARGGARLRANKGAVAALWVVVLLVAAAIVGPGLSPNDLETLDWAHVAADPGFAHAHWFGTDRLGRDLFVRTLEGARVSMVVGLLAGSVSLGLGLAFGAVAGYVGGRTDDADDAVHRDHGRPAAHLLRHFPDRGLRREIAFALFVVDRRGRLAHHSRGSCAARP